MAEKKDSIDINKVAAILNQPELTPTAIRDALKGEGIKSQAAADKWAQKYASEGTGGFISKGLHNVGSLGGWAHLAGDVGSWVADSLRSSPAKKKADPTKPAGNTAADQQAAEQKALQAQIQAVENSPWTKLSNALAQQYSQEMTPILQDVSGAQIPGAQAAAGNQALASLGLSPNSSAGQWLSSEAAASQAATAPVAAAMNQEAAQMQQGIGPVTQALMNYGQANALSVETAPEASWLSALGSHITSNLSYYGVIPTASLPSLSPAVAKALQLSGGYSGTSGAGTTPIQNITASPTGGSQVAKNATSLLGAGSSSAGVIPGAGTNPAA